MGGPVSGATVLGWAEEAGVNFTLDHAADLANAIANGQVDHDNIAQAFLRVLGLS